MNTNFFVSPNTLMVECIIKPSNGTTQTLNPFGTQQQLQNRKIVAIETFANCDFSYSPISTGNQVIPGSIFTNAFLTLYTSSVFAVDPKTGKSTDVLERPEGLYYDRIPLSTLRRVNTYATGDSNPFLILPPGGRDLFRIRPTELSWTKCQVVIPNPIAMGTDPYSVLLQVHYLDEGDSGAAYRS